MLIEIVDKPTIGIACASGLLIGAIEFILGADKLSLSVSVPTAMPQYLQID
jgi:hypothetical protein